MNRFIISKNNSYLAHDWLIIRELLLSSCYINLQFNTCIAYMRLQLMN